METQMFRKTVSKRTVAQVALYLLIKLAKRGKMIIRNEELSKLLFFAFYTKAGSDNKPLLIENPPILDKDTSFRIYLKGPYIRISKLIELINYVSCSIIGECNINVVNYDKNRIIVTLAAERYFDRLEKILSEEIERKLGREFKEKIDSWILSELVKYSPDQLSKMALQVLYLEAEGLPIKKAMVFNMNLDDYIDMLYKLKLIYKNINNEDYELDDILVEE